MGQAASPSLYDFAGGDPVNFFDPTGRCNVPSNNRFTNGLYKPTEVNTNGAPAVPIGFGQNSTDPNREQQNAPGTMTIGAGYGIAVVVTISTDASGNTLYTLGVGYGLGFIYNVSTSTPTTTGLSGNSGYVGVVASAQGNIGSAAASGSLSSGASYDANGNYIVGDTTLSGSVTIPKTPLDLGAEVNVNINGNINNDSSVHSPIEIKGDASTGFGGMLFVGVQGGLLIKKH
jgi:hypothetical protein